MSVEALETVAAETSRPDPPRDQWGRYLIPDPVTGEVGPWTRVTTFARTLADTFALTKWQCNMTALGLARRPDLLAQAATVVDPDAAEAKALLSRVTEAAQEMAGSKVRANLGTALHSFTEHIDVGREVRIPEPYVADLDAYREATRDLAIDPTHVERIVTVIGDGWKVAGTFDRLVTLDGRLVVADLKTGRDLSRAWSEIVIQLALYAHAGTLWDQTTGEHEPMPEVDLDRALVLHLPVGEGRCDLWEVDIAAGWEMVQTCAEVRAWRNRRDLARRYDGSAQPAPTSVPAAPVDADGDSAATPSDWIRRRITALLHDAANGPLIAQEWPDVPSPKDARETGWTDEQIDAIDAALRAVEQYVGAPFPDPDPRVEETTSVPLPDPPPVFEHDSGPDGEEMSEADVNAIRDTVEALPDVQARLVKGWARDAKAAGTPFASSILHRRTWEVSRAAIACARYFWDEDDPDLLTRAALRVVLGDLHPSWRNGVLLAALTTEEAERLSDLADLYEAGDSMATDVVAASLAVLVRDGDPDPERFDP